MFDIASRTRAGCAILGLLAVAGAAGATDVTLRLVDENSQLIAGSHFYVFSYGYTVLQDGTVSLAPGTYTFQLRPGLVGSLQCCALLREEVVEVSGSTQVIEWVWPTADLLVRIVDQATVAIPSSTYHLPGTGLAFPAGSPLRLPVTDDPGRPPITGAYAGGYFFTVKPGINGIEQCCSLLRDEPAGELGAAGATRDVVWRTADLTVRVVDQDGDDVPASGFHIWGSGVVFDAGTTHTLPVTEDDDAPAISGDFADGYHFQVRPGIYGSVQCCSLLRDEPREELGTAGATRNVLWEVGKGPLDVVDGNEQIVAGASYRLLAFLPESPTGTTYNLPINDDVLYPGLYGDWAGGYPFSIRTASGSPLAGPFALELQTGAAFNPPFVAIDGAQYGLRFDAQAVTDLDGDGYSAPDDCDDSDPATHPGAPDIPGDAANQDCSGAPVCDPAATWRNHGAFVSCVAREAEALFDAGRITEAQKDEIVSGAAQSNVGRR